jgi:hypothetical protein
VIEPRRKSTIADKLSEEIDEKDNGIYAIGHKSEEEREETRKAFRKFREAYEKNKYFSFMESC